MRFLVLFLLVSIQIPSNLAAGEATRATRPVTFNFEQTPLVVVLDWFKMVAKFEYTFADGIDKNEFVVSAQVSDAPADIALYWVLRPIGLTCDIDGAAVSIRKIGASHPVANYPFPLKEASRESYPAWAQKMSKKLARKTTFKSRAMKSVDVVGLVRVMSGANVMLSASAKFSHPKFTILDTYTTPRDLLVDFVKKNNLTIQYEKEVLYIW